MAFVMDEVWVNDGQLLCCAEGIVPIALGVGPAKIRGSGYVEGPFQVGNPFIFPSVYATVMIGPTSNPKSPKPALSISQSKSGKFVVLFDCRRPFTLCKAMLFNTSFDHGLREMSSLGASML